MPPKEFWSAIPSWAMGTIAIMLGWKMFLGPWIHEFMLVRKEKVKVKNGEGSAEERFASEQLARHKDERMREYLEQHFRIKQALKEFKTVCENDKKQDARITTLETKQVTTERSLTELWTESTEHGKGIERLEERTRGAS